MAGLTPYTLPSCWKFGFWDLPLIHGNSGVCVKDALAPPLPPLKPRGSTTTHQRQGPAIDALLKENTCGLDYLRQQEQHGRDRESKRPKRKASSKKLDIVKLSLVLASFMLAPQVWALYAN